jgi:hypothetical protein
MQLFVLDMQYIVIVGTVAFANWYEVKLNKAHAIMMHPDVFLVFFTWKPNDYDQSITQRLIEELSD